MCLCICVHLCVFVRGCARGACGVALATMTHHVSWNKAGDTLLACMSVLRHSLTFTQLVCCPFLVVRACLQGEVLSVEDYGYRVSFGPRGFHGFLPFTKTHSGNDSTANADGKRARSKKYVVGQIVQTMVESINSAAKLVAVRELGTEEADVDAVVPKRNLNATFRALKPGMQVEASVVKVCWLFAVCGGSGSADIVITFCLWHGKRPAWLWLSLEPCLVWSFDS